MPLFWLLNCFAPIDCLPWFTNIGPLDWVFAIEHSCVAGQGPGVHCTLNSILDIHTMLMEKCSYFPLFCKVYSFSVIDVLETGAYTPVSRIADLDPGFFMWKKDSPGFSVGLDPDLVWTLNYSSIILFNIFF